MAQPDWLLSLLLCSGPLKPPVHMKLSVSPANRKHNREKKKFSNQVERRDDSVFFRLVDNSLDLQSIFHINGCDLIRDRDEKDSDLQFTLAQPKSRDYADVAYILIKKGL